VKVVLLVAGRGTRLLPLTETTPKPLLPVAGAPVLEHILTRLRTLPIEELIVVTGHLGECIEAYLGEFYKGRYRNIAQERLDGTGGAVNAAIDHINCPALVVFGDSIFDADLSGLLKRPDKNVIWTQTVEDYQRFGIVQTDQLGNMKTIVEKPQQDVGRNANIGVYYVSAHRALRDSLQRIMAGPAIKGEYYFTYALNDMVENGQSFKVAETDGWHDCGDFASLLATNRRLLADNKRAPPSGFSAVTIVPPVTINESANLQDCRIGPDVSIGSGSRITSSSISNAIVARNCLLNNVVVRNSIVGDGERLTDLNLHGCIAANGKIIKSN
jgi:glucose-1-phosphate thymidylyltransferase